MHQHATRELVAVDAIRRPDLAGAVLDLTFIAEADVQRGARANFRTLRNDCFSASTLRGISSRAQQAMFTSVHSSPCSMTYASRSLDCAILVSDQRSRVIVCVASTSFDDYALVPFKGVVARGPSGGVCPMSVHLPEPHFFAVSDSCCRLTHARSCVRSLRHSRMLRVFRAVLLRVRARVHARLSVLGEQIAAPACIGCMRVAILHSLRN